MLAAPTAIAFRILGATLLLMACAFGATSSGVEITARVTPTEITVGDPVRYEITVKHPAAARVELPEVRGNVGSLEVLEYAVRGDSGLDGRRTITHALSLTAYEVGLDTIPPQRVEIRSPDDTTASVYFTQPTMLLVKASAPQNAQDIAEIHDEDKLPRSFPWGLPLFLAALAAGVWGLRIWKRRRAMRPVVTVTAPPPTVGEVAYARLAALEREGLVAANRSREFAFALSEILREYLANRYDIDAMEATTAELLERVDTAEIILGRPEWLRAFCEELDAVKFADTVLTVDSEARLLTEVRIMIRATISFPSVNDTMSSEAQPIPNASAES